MVSTSPSRNKFIFVRRRQRIAAESATERFSLSACRGLPAAVARQVGVDRISSALQAASHLNQILDMHVGGERITSRLGDFALDIDDCRIHLRHIAVHQQAVARFEQNVVGGIAGQALHPDSR